MGLQKNWIVLALLWQIRSLFRILPDAVCSDLRSDAAWRTGTMIFRGGFRRFWRDLVTRRGDVCVRSTSEA